MCQRMKFSEAVARGATRLAEAGVEQPRREARRLAGHLLGLQPGVAPNPNQPIDPASYNALIARRAAREPYAFITGRQGFWTLDLATAPSTLIPRPDSETLIEAALKLFPDRAAIRTILDLGTGTGCLLLAALTEFPAAFGIGIDLSPEAAALAAANAAAHGLSARAAVLASNWADPLAARVDLVLSNPPYIRTADLPLLMPEVGRHEPARALDGGADGLSAYRALAQALPRLLNPGGAAILELGLGQADQVRNLAIAAGLHHLRTDSDLAGIPRAAILCRAADAAGFEKKPFGSTAVGS
jgi:release factor glutamine methyltransferase